MFLDCAPVMPWVLLWEPWALVFQVSTWGTGWETFPLGHPGRRASLLQPVPQISKQMPSLSPRSPPLLRSLCCSDWAMSPGSPQLVPPYCLPRTETLRPAVLPPLIQPWDCLEMWFWGSKAEIREPEGRKGGRKRGNQSVTAPSQSCDVMLLGFCL